MIKQVLTKAHIYLGLFLVVDLWLFSLTGLFLNHPQWGVNDYRAAAKWVESTVPVKVPDAGSPLERARDYMRQLGLEGELVSVRHVAEQQEFRFDLYKPGRNARVRIDLERAQARVGRQQVDSYGMLNQLHILTAMQRFDPKKEQLTWVATRLWVLTMDGLALGLIVLVLTALYMWIQTGKFLSGAVALILGSGLGILFLLL